MKPGPAGPGKEERMIKGKGSYGCDAGSLKIAASGFSVMFSNRIGDGCFHFYVVDSMKDLPEGHQCAGFFQTEKTAYVMGYDCDGYIADGGDLEPGAYIVEAAENGDMYLWYLSDETEYWGGNLD